MERRRLGRQGLTVSALGLGCMGMSWAYGKPDEAEVIRTLHRALDLGIDFWDTAEIYGPFRNEELLGKALEGKRKKVIIATKFAFKFDANGNRIGLDSSPPSIRRAIEGSLKRLRTDYIDLYYQHRLDPATPIEETVGCLAELVNEGKVRTIGLSEVGPTTIRRAHKVHPVTAVQSEYSLWERGLEEKVIPALRELGIGLVAYSPLGRGFLTGKIRDTDELDPSDFRRTVPRLQKENLGKNLRLVHELERLATANRVTPSQIALAWVLDQGDDIVPIPGTTRVKHLEENLQAVELPLTQASRAELKKIANEFKPAGARYAAELLKTISTE
jgi:aryl-alcohol dehydrogenase-like predicted oxidoreductase